MPYEKTTEQKARAFWEAYGGKGEAPAHERLPTDKEFEEAYMNTPKSTDPLTKMVNYFRSLKKWKYDYHPSAFLELDNLAVLLQNPEKGLYLPPFHGEKIISLHADKFLEQLLGVLLRKYNAGLPFNTSHGDSSILCLASHGLGAPVFMNTTMAIVMPESFEAYNALIEHSIDYTTYPMEIRNTNLLHLRKGIILFDIEDELLIFLDCEWEMGELSGVTKYDPQNFCVRTGVSFKRSHPLHP